MKVMKLLFGVLLGVMLTGVAEAGEVRGTLAFDEGGTERNSMAHWDEFGWDFEAIRWGRYHVEVSYFGLKNAMGVQARLRANGDDRAKGFLKPGGTKDEPQTVRLGGSVYVVEHGEQEIVLFTPQDDPKYDFKIVGLKLVPAPEGGEIVAGDNGSVILLAKDATTFSEKMRYEPKEVKNCLGFWTFKDDWAQWEFELGEGGAYSATVFQGCGGDNGGSTVAIEAGEERITFKVEDTGGFQNWKAIEIGELKFEAGVNRVAIRPVDQKGKAVLDVQKIVLTPVK